MILHDGYDVAGYLGLRLDFHALSRTGERVPRPKRGRGDMMAPGLGGCPLPHLLFVFTPHLSALASIEVYVGI